MDLEKKVIKKLKTIYDPEIPVDIYNLGLIYSIDFEYCMKGYYCNIVMSFTSPNCPVADFLIASVNIKVGSVHKIYKVNVEVTFDPPWTPQMISEEGREIFAMENMDIG